MFLSKNIKAVKSKVDTATVYKIEEAINVLREASYVKFDGTLEVVCKLNLDTKRFTVRGIAPMPGGTGKNVRIAVVCKDERFEEAKAAGADLVGGADLIAEIKKGVTDFDVCIATPDMMGLMGQVARILGPKGLMPNPKLGTVTTDLAGAISSIKAGQVEFRADKGGIVHAGVGKLSFSNDSLLKNVASLVNEVIKAKPQGSKGEYLKKVFISSTMMPALSIDYKEVATF